MLKLKSKWYHKENIMRERTIWRKDCIRAALRYCVFYYAKHNKSRKATLASKILIQANKPYSQFGFGRASSTDKRNRYVKLNEAPWLRIEIPYWDYQPQIEELDESEIEEEAQDNGQFGLGA